MKNIAIVHDWLNQLGGAEDVLETMHRMFPTSPIFTSIYDRERMPANWKSWDIRGSWMDKLPKVYRKHQPYMPLFATMWATRKIDDIYDTVISNKSAFCIGVNVAPHAKHICYCLTPTRFIYDFDSYAQRENIPSIAKPILRMVCALLRRWESNVAQNVTTFIAISKEIQSRIKRNYNRDSSIIYPPVNVERFQTVSNLNSNGDYFFIASRLLPYKRIDLAIQACGRLGLPLKIAGAGRDAERLAKLAAKYANITLLGRVSDAEMGQLMSECRAFIFPGLEDFGITPIQAMACGKPVIAFAGGGALDTVIPHQTGILFQDQTVISLENALQLFSEVRFAPDFIQEYAEQFSEQRFISDMRSVLAI